MRWYVGMPVLLNPDWNGSALPSQGKHFDTPLTLDGAYPPNAPIAQTCVHGVLESGQGVWVQKNTVRPMRRMDHRRIAGLRFCDWQRSLSWSLWFHCGASLAIRPRNTWQTMWHTGMSVARTMDDLRRAGLITPLHHTAPDHLATIPAIALDHWYAAQARGT